MGRFIVRGATPDVTLTNSDTTLDLRLMGTPKVTIKQGCVKMDFDNITVAEHSLTFGMTQSQTLSLDAGRNNKTCDIQVHFIKNGKRTESFIVQVPVYNTLHDEVIS